MEQQIIKIPNFKLNVFRNLLEQSLIVNNQLMLEFSPDIVKSCSFSLTNSFMKLWTAPLKNLLFVEQPNNDIDSPDLFAQTKTEEVVFNFPVFNFYILKGDVFKKYLSVHNSDTVDLEFVLHKNGNKYQAASMAISSKTDSNSPLKTNFILTTEDLITNKIDDYSSIIEACTPTKSSFSFILTSNQIQEIKRLIKTLHKTIPDNTAYLNFVIDVNDKTINVKDKVFDVKFEIINQESKCKLPTENIEFKILKSDFIMTGNHTFVIYTEQDDLKVILGTNYANAILMILTSKVTEETSELDSTITDISIDNLEIAEYL